MIKPSCVPPPLIFIEHPLPLFGFRMAWWEANHYTSTCLPSEESGSEEEFEEDELGQNVDLDYKDADLNYIKYVMGDVTHPQAEEEDAIIVHCLGGTCEQQKDCWVG